MTTLFIETGKQYSSVRRFLHGIAASRALMPLVGAGLLTAVLWNTGLFAAMLDSLPEWAQVPVMMPLFGSMLAVYALGGLATVSLFMSALFDLVLMPFRRAGLATTEEI